MTTRPHSSAGMPVSDIVTYEYVTERDEDDKYTTGKTVFQYDVQAKDQFIGSINFSFSSDRSWLRGQLLKESYYDRNKNLIKQIQYNYEVVEFSNVIRGLLVNETYKLEVGVGSYCIGCGECFKYLINGDQCTLLCPLDDIKKIRRDQLFFRDYDEPISYKRLISKTETLDGVTSTTTLEYDPLRATANTLAAQTTDSKNKIQRTEIRSHRTVQYE
jgi:hypothetical protein